MEKEKQPLATSYPSENSIMISLYSTPTYFIQRYILEIKKRIILILTLF